MYLWRYMLPSHFNIVLQVKKKRWKDKLPCQASNLGDWEFSAPSHYLGQVCLHSYPYVLPVITDYSVNILLTDNLVPPEPPYIG